MSTYQYESTFGYLLFDFAQEIIFVENTIAVLEVQEIVNGLREAESEIPGISYPEIGDATGKSNLSAASTVQVGITLELFGNWRIYSERDTGFFTVLGGNLLRSDGGNPFEANPGLSYINIQSAAATIVNVSSGPGTGDGFTANDRTVLQGVSQDTQAIRTAQTAQLTESRFKSLSFNRKNTVNNKTITSYRPNDEIQVNVTYNADGVPTEENIQ